MMIGCMTGNINETLSVPWTVAFENRTGLDSSFLMISARIRVESFSMKS